jgi:type IV pilus assembly protein PilW
MRTTSPQQHLGVTLIELMVGLAIGLVILLAVFQIYGTWDGRQRTGSAKNDAQMVGTLAAVTLEHDLRQAAHGFGPASSPTELRTGCVTSAFFGAVFTFNLMPVEIINGAAGASDQINVLYGSSGHRSTREWVVGSTATTKTLINRAGFMAGDRVVLSNSVVANTCQMIEITAATTAIVGDPRSFWHATGPYQSAYTAVGVFTNATMNDAAGTGANEFDQAFNIGPAPQANSWRIGGASPLRPVLQRTNRFPTNGVASAAVEVAEGIVNLQAQYGYDTDGNGQIAANEWLNAAPAVPDWSRLLAVRYGLLARSRNYEALPFRAPNPAWAGGQFVMADISNSPGGADTNPLGANNWRAYRHMVYEGVIPMRNVLWGQAL